MRLLKTLFATLGILFLLRAVLALRAAYLTEHLKREKACSAELHFPMEDLPPHLRVSFEAWLKSQIAAEKLKEALGKVH